MTRRAIEFSISVSHFLGGYPPVRACPITLAEVRDQRISQFISVKEECDQLERPPDSELRIRPPDSDLRIRPPGSDLRIRPPGSDLRIRPPDSDLRIVPPDSDLRILPPDSTPTQKLSKSLG